MLRPPVPVIDLLRQFPVGAELIQYGALLRRRSEPVRRQIPDGAERRIVEEDAAVGTEYRHAGGELVERAGMRLRRALELAAHRLHLRYIDRAADRAVGGRHVEDLQAPPVARHDGGGTVPI